MCKTRVDAFCYENSSRTADVRAEVVFDDDKKSDVDATAAEACTVDCSLTSMTKTLNYLFHGRIA